MAMKVLVVPDKFKGTLTAHEATELMTRGWRSVRPGDTLEPLPMSDGGDGFGRVMGALLGMEEQQTPAVDAAHQPTTGLWWLHPETRLAVIEAAQVVGLAMLPPGVFHPFDLDTFGLGAVLKAARESGAREVLVGIGGSATNDGGFGLARALGWRFLGPEGRELRSWADLSSLRSILPPAPAINDPPLTVAVDVQNPLLGERGASRIYGPQKGLREADLPLAESCLSCLAEVAETQCARPGARLEPGTGAAGGLGFGLRCFCGGRLESGFTLFARHAELARRIRQADLVLTGEGAIDSSSLMGKGVGEVASLCRAAGVPCLGLGGTVSDQTKRNHGEMFHRLYGIVGDLTSPEAARAEPQKWLPELAALAARQWAR